MKLRTTRWNPARRPAFTLLEVLLASLLLAVVLGALYMAFDLTLRQTKDSREAADADILARGVTTRMTIDLGNTLAPLPPRSGGNTNTSQSSDGSSSSTTMPSTGTAATAAPAAAAAAPAPATAATDATATAAPTSDDSSTTPQPVQASPMFQGGVIGTSTTLTVFTSRVPLALTEPNGLAQEESQADGQAPRPQHDLVRITYWLGQNGGLCRQERPWVTADAVASLGGDPDLTDEASDTIAPEVIAVQFEYYGTYSDGTTDWRGDWNAETTGPAVGPDSTTPLGPPKAVRVTLTVKIPGTEIEKKVVQVIPVRASPGPNTPPIQAAPMDATGDGTTTPSTGSTTPSTGTTGGGTTTTTPSTGATAPASSGGAR